MSELGDRLPLTIGLAGRMGAGKDFIANVLREEGYMPLALAFALKMDVAHLCKVDYEFIETHKGSFRSLLQAYGEAMRMIHGPDYWLKRWERLAVQHRREAPRQRLVITDLRYRNEVEWAKSMGVYTVRVWVTEDLRRHRLAARDGTVTEEQLNHPSESAVDTLPVDSDFYGIVPPDHIVEALYRRYVASRKFSKESLPWSSTFHDDVPLFSPSPALS